LQIEKEYVSKQEEFSTNHEMYQDTRTKLMSTFAEVLVEFLPTDRGGRRNPIFLGENPFVSYKPHFRLCHGDETYLGVEFVDGPDEAITPGGRTYATVRFLYEPEVSYDNLIEGALFDICEGSRVVGSGQVTRR
jgi:hypothetical protein